MQARERRPFHRRRQHFLSRRQHNRIKLPLGARKLAAHGPRARDVRGVAVQLAPGVHQQQISGAADFVVARVVDGAAVASGGDDRGIGTTGGAAQAAAVLEQSRQGGLARPWGSGGHARGDAVGGGRSRGGHEGHLGGGFDPAQAVHQGAEGVDARAAQEEGGGGRRRRRRRRSCRCR